MLGIDPGLVATGYGLIEPGPRGVVVLDRGVITTSRALPLEERVHLIYEGVLRLFGEHRPAMVALEDLYAEYRFPRTALLMAHARGVICLAARQRGVAVLALAPALVKRALTGNGGASKEQIQHAVRHVLGLSDLPRPSHIADALALALTGFSRAGGRIG